MRSALLFLLLVILLPLSVVIQDLLPGVPPSQERVLLLPMLFCFGALALPLVPALFFALATALVQGLALLQVQSGQAEFGMTLPVIFFLAWAIVLQISSEATRGMRWELHAIGSALVTMTLLVGQFLILAVKRGGFSFDQQSVLSRISVPTAISLLIAPLLYLLLKSLVPLSSEAKTAHRSGTLMP
jgi:D-alanyl-lipoteichoic acid acyltransferase DltB (MBOAT superfamily)